MNYKQNEYKYIVRAKDDTFYKATFTRDEYPTYPNYYDLDGFKNGFIFDYKDVKLNLDIKNINKLEEHFIGNSLLLPDMDLLSRKAKEQGITLMPIWAYKDDQFHIKVSQENPNPEKYELAGARWMVSCSVKEKTFDNYSKDLENYLNGNNYIFTLQDFNSFDEKNLFDLYLDYINENVVKEYASYFITPAKSNCVVPCPDNVYTKSELKQLNEWNDKHTPQELFKQEIYDKAYKEIQAFVSANYCCDDDLLSMLVNQDWFDDYVNLFKDHDNVNAINNLFKDEIEQFAYSYSHNFER